jgi:hypothetical protein
LTISSHRFWVSATANPSKSDDWKGSIDKGAFMIKKESISDIKTQKYGLFFSNYVFPNEYLYISSLCSCLLKYRIMSISCLDKTKPLKVLSPSPRLQKGTTGDYPLSNQANTYIAVPILAKPLKCSENLPCPLPQKTGG